MSSPLAIASVTRVLKDLLNNRMIDHNVSDTVGNVRVTALPPDFIVTGVSAEVSQLNLFMYMVTPNQGWRNQRLPSHNSSGDRISNPPLALDLHYLLTAYGSDELHHEILLGYGMQLFHEVPLLTRDSIRTALAPTTVVAPTSLPPELQSLSTSGLADQIEHIKITPESLNTEELSRLWTAFGAKYRPNAAYRATVVLIESSKSTKSALPVRERLVYVKPFHQPVIEKISSQATAGQPIVDNQKIIPGYNLVLNGIQLKGEIVSVLVGETSIPQSNLTTLTDNQIIFQLPNTLHAGIQGVQVVHAMLMGIASPPEEHQGVSSNVQAFVLSPDITSVNFINGIDAGGIWSGSVVLELAAEVWVSQRIVLLLNELNPAASTIAKAYSFEILGIAISSPPAPTTTISIPIRNVETGTYLVRLQVDGAESPLTTDSNLSYNSPMVDIP
jgi:hypothetical protein